MKARDLIMFVAGCAVGGIGASLYLKDVYRRYAQEEIDSVIDRERHKREEVESLRAETEEDVKEESNIEKAQKAAKTAANKSSLTEYADIVKKEGYTDYNAITKPENEDKPMREVDPISYISSSDYGVDEEYEQIELVYYQDGILADEDGEIVDDIPATVGNEFDEHFQEFDDDDNAVYVQNDARKAYYVIYMSDEEYKEAFNV